MADRPFWAALVELSRGRLNLSIMERVEKSKLAIGRRNRVPRQNGTIVRACAFNGQDERDMYRPQFLEKGLKTEHMDFGHII